PLLLTRNINIISQQLFKNAITSNSFNKCQSLNEAAKNAHIITNIIFSPNPLIANTIAEFNISLSTSNFIFKNDTFMNIYVIADSIPMYYGRKETNFCTNPDNSDCPKEDFIKMLYVDINSGLVTAPSDYRIQIWLTDFNDRNAYLDYAADCLEANFSISTTQSSFYQLKI
ncbi:12609_t:CDS:1, partial [Dentiscutata heterogama]